MSAISRKPLRSQIRSYLVDRLLASDLAPNTQLNESELTEELGVSRTPLREALLQLEFEGLLQSTPGKGFSVAPLERKEMEELFDVGVSLETWALQCAGGVDEKALGEMRAINEERAEILQSGDDRDELVRLDDRWHQILVSGCENSQLHELLRLVRNRLYRYVYFFEGDEAVVQAAIKNHEAIQDALAEGALERAEEHLRRHWHEGKESMARLMDDLA